MKMKSLILIFIALGCGLVASIGISQVMERGSSGNVQMEMDQILVSLAEVDAGAKLDAQNVKLEDWPKAKVPEGAVRSLEDVKDKFTLVRFYKGEPILLAKISDQARNFTMTIPNGYRVMPVKVDEDTVMKAVQVGDRVDVMVFLRRGDEVQRTGSYPILRNVRIFAVGANTERTVDEKGKEVAARTVSLLVKPKQSQELAVAAQMGKILLAVRPPNEVDDETTEDVIPIGDILSGKASNADDGQSATLAPPTTPNQTGGLLNLISNTVNSSANANPAGEPTGPQPIKFKMHVFTPNGVSGYEWTDRDALPTESTIMASATAAQPAPPAAVPTTTTPTTDEPTAPTLPADGATTITSPDEN